MIHSPTPSRAARLPTRGGFTLIEMLIVLAILAILAGITFGALSQAADAGRAERTKGLVAKLHGQIMPKYESYPFRRVFNPSLSADTTGMGIVALRRMQSLRDLQRYELPDQYIDFVASTTPFPASVRTPTALAMPPSAALAYLRRYNTNQVNGTSAKPSAAFESAECLFLIMTIGLGEEGLSGYQLAGVEIGDKDNDGMKEFHDGWGNPISYIRWPVRFVSDLQPIPIDPATGSPNPNLRPVRYPDPLDPRGVDQTGGVRKSFAVYPLIFSGGPDGIGDTFVGLSDGDTAAPHVNPLNPFDPTNRAGNIQDLPSSGVAANGQLDHLDNIHNHLIGARQ